MSLLFQEPDAGQPLGPGIAGLALRSARVAPLAAELARRLGDGRLERSLEDLAQSHVHMWLERLCTSQTRFHE